MDETGTENPLLSEDFRLDCDTFAGKELHIRPPDPQDKSRREGSPRTSKFFIRKRKGRSEVKETHIWIICEPHM
jgi:hypothetical protein